MLKIMEKIVQVKTNIPKILWMLLFIALMCIIGLCAALIVVSTQNKLSKNLCGPVPNNKSEQSHYMHSAISSDTVPCSNIANNIMMVKGGNAVDGALAGLICDCAVNFHSCGIGGGSFIVIYIKKNRTTYAIDIREEAPASSSESMYRNDPLSSQIGGKSIAVMGLITGYYEIHKKLGKLPWELLFTQTIDLLNKGFFVSRTIEDAIDYFLKSGNAERFSELRSVISDSVTGKPKRFGDIIKLPKLSLTLATVAREPHALRNGSLVAYVVSEIGLYGGNITKEDLGRYQVKWREPVSVPLRMSGHVIYTTPPPSSGALVTFILNLLSEYSFDSSYLDSCEKAGLFYHRFIEVMKFAFGKRSDLGDMDFVDVKTIMANLTSHNFMRWIKSLIKDDRTHDFKYYHTRFLNNYDHGTAHFSLISEDGDAVSATSTINNYFGSFVMGSETGIVYNNEMDDFSSPYQSNMFNLAPSRANFIRPKKRPMSSMSPIIIVDERGNVKLVVGASGGPKIISATAFVSVLTILLKMEIKKSIDQPRAHHQLSPNTVFVDKTFPKGIIDQLEKRGHKVVSTKHMGVVEGIHRSNEDYLYLECNSDFRKMGRCNGY